MNDDDFSELERAIELKRKWDKVLQEKRSETSAEETSMLVNLELLRRDKQLCQEKLDRGDFEAFLVYLGCLEKDLVSAKLGIDVRMRLSELRKKAKWWIRQNGHLDEWSLKEWKNLYELM